MSHHMTTNVRLPEALHEQLEQAARKLRRRKSWIIVHALELYLKKRQHNALVKEAHRQSLLAAQADSEEEMRFWEENADTTE